MIDIGVDDGDEQTLLIPPSLSLSSVELAMVFIDANMLVAAYELCSERQIIIDLFLDVGRYNT